MRRSEGSTQGEFAKKVGITQSYLSLIEQGHKEPSSKVLDEMAEKLNTHISVLHWKSVEESDVKPGKIDAFRVLKPLLDNLCDVI